MLDIIANKIFESVIDTGTSILSNALERKNNEQLVKHEQAKKKNKHATSPILLTATFSTTRQTLENSLKQHIESIKNWCQIVRFSDLKNAKSISQIYVELDTYLMPLNLHEDSCEKDQTEPLLKTIQYTYEHCVILGTAGAGKTTSIQKICSDYFINGKVLRKYNLPILIKLRDISSNDSEPILTALRQILAISISINSEAPIEDINFINSIERRILLNYLDELNAVVLLDGFDELPTEHARDAAIRDIQTIISSIKQTKIIITSRSSDFRYKLSDVRKFEIASLNKDQISDFARRWLNSNEKSSDFLKKIYESPFADTAIRPLTIAHLCAIYERIQDIPDKPKSVYKRIVNLLLEDWDSQRHIKRPSSYANFDHDRKSEFLAHLAFFMTTELERLRFSDDQLKFAYSKIHTDHGLPGHEAIKVTSELESHSGLIIESGRGYFEFAHKSIQEYLAADYIVRLPNLDLIENKVHLLPNELAIATSLSSMSCLFLAELFLKQVDLERESTGWLQTYLSRLLVEKPDLNVGASEYSAIAGLHILSRLKNSDDITKLLRGAFPTDTNKKISKFYQVAGSDLMDTRFRRISSSQKYRLPDYLNIPTKFLKSINFP